MKIFDILPIGEENAIPAKQLAAQLGLSERECRARVSKELQEGAFCLSSMHRPGGYFRPSEGEKGRNELIRFLLPGTCPQPFQCAQAGRDQKRSVPAGRADRYFELVEEDAQSK